MQKRPRVQNTKKNFLRRKNLEKKKAAHGENDGYSSRRGKLWKSMKWNKLKEFT